MLIPVNLYLWIKIIDYAYSYCWTIREATLFDVLTLSINIPVYISAIFYVFKVRSLPNLFWKIWVVIAILDEVRASIEYYSGFVDLILYTSPIIPLYIIGVIYAYLSPTIWQSSTAQ